MLHHFATGMGSHAPAFRWFFRVAETGWMGVDLFFVLSGFLITGILHDARARPRHYFRDFYMRRALRIVPLYYATLALAILPTVGPLAGSRALGLWTIRPDQAWYWCYGVNLLLAFRGRFYPLGNYWTLSVEEHFYLAWPIAVFLLSRKALMACCVAMFAGALATRLGMIAAHANPIAIYVLTPCRMDTLSAGAFVALAARGPGGLLHLLPRACWSLAISGALLLILFARHGVLSSLTLDSLSIGDSLTAIGSASLVALSASPRPARLIRLAFTSPPMRALGKYSYGLYMIHCLLWPALPGILPGHRADIRNAAEFLSALGYIALATALCFALAWLSWHLFERRFLALKGFFEGEGRG